MANKFNGLVSKLMPFVLSTSIAATPILSHAQSNQSTQSSQNATQVQEVEQKPTFTTNINYNSKNYTVKIYGKNYETGKYDIDSEDFSEVEKEIRGKILLSAFAKELVGQGLLERTVYDFNLSRETTRLADLISGGVGLLAREGREDVQEGNATIELERNISERMKAEWAISAVQFLGSLYSGNANLEEYLSGVKKKDLEGAERSIPFKERMRMDAKNIEMHISYELLDALNNIQKREKVESKYRRSREERFDDKAYNLAIYVPTYPAIMAHPLMYILPEGVDLLDEALDIQKLAKESERRELTGEEYLDIVYGWKSLFEEMQPTVELIRNASFNWRPKMDNFEIAKKLTNPKKSSTVYNHELRRFTISPGLIDSWKEKFVKTLVFHYSIFNTDEFKTYSRAIDLKEEWMKVKRNPAMVFFDLLASE